MSPLSFVERPAAGAAAGLLVLHHGRGANEHDLLPLGEVLDPGHELHIVSPRAPHAIPGTPGYHWYGVPRVGYPDRATFELSVERLSAFHDELWDRTGLSPERTVRGGFSMGSVMSYALGLHPERPRAAGLLAFSGFVPTVEGWAPDLVGRRGLPVFIAHGREDAVIEVGFGRRARELLESGGLDVEYHESDVGHQIDHVHLPAAIAWLDACLGLESEA
jgi:phospholipase/carboxylesterase